MREPIPNQEKPIASSTITVENLLPFLNVSLGRHDEVCLIFSQLLPPRKSDIILELAVSHGFGFFIAMFNPFSR
jgi:hypothetical protein